MVEDEGSMQRSGHQGHSQGCSHRIIRVHSVSVNGARQGIVLICRKSLDIGDRRIVHRFDRNGYGCR